jgi:hypothetical protein
MRRVLVALAVLLIGSAAHAQGILIPVEKKLPPLALVDQKVAIDIVDQVAVTRNVLNRNVIDVGGVWIDDGFNPKLETVTVKAMSDAYFRVLERHPQVKEVFQLGNYLVWVTPSGKALIIDQGHGADEMPDADIDRLFVAPAKK